MATQYPDNNNQQLLDRIAELEERNKKLNIELMQRSAEAVEAQERELRLEINVQNLQDLIVVRDLIGIPNTKDKLTINALAEQKRLRMLIEIHKLHTGHNLCWMNDLQLWREALGDNSIEYPHDTIPPQDEFEPGCEVWCRPYYKSRSKCQGQLLAGKPPALPGYEKSK